MSIIVFWLDPQGVPQALPFSDAQLTQALSCAADRRKEGLRHVTISSEMGEHIGKPGVGAVEQGRLPNGEVYDWSKKHRGNPTAWHVQGRFRVEGSRAFAGLHSPTHRWNGWAVPAFTAAVSHDIARAFCSSDLRVAHDPASDRFFEEKPGHPTRRVVFDVILGPEGERLHLMGSGWRWEEVLDKD